MGKNIRDLFVKIDLAEQLIKLGFDESCFGIYSQARGFNIEGTPPYSEMQRKNPIHKGGVGCNNIPIPMIQQVVDWFKEYYNLHIVTIPKVMYPDNMVGAEYYYEIYHNDKHYAPDGVYNVDSVLEVAIKSALAIINKVEENIPMEEKEKQLTPEEIIINNWFGNLTKERREIFTRGTRKALSSWSELTLEEKRNVYYFLI
jgi:hypothetical protein